MFTTAICAAEVLYGVKTLPRRPARLRGAVEDLFDREFRGSILPFEGHCAPMFARIAAAREKPARPISQFDAIIASICRSRGAAVATRNVHDFEHCGVPIVNPWSE